MAGERARPALERLVDADAFDRCWEAEILHAVGRGSFDDVLSLDMLDAVITQRGPVAPAFTGLHRGRRVPQHTLARTDLGRAPSTQRLDPVKVLDMFESRGTLVLGGLQRYVPTMDAFVRALSADVGHAMEANAYLTPPGSQGAGAHWDRHSVLLRQIHGAKIWTIARPVERWTVAMPDHRVLAAEHHGVYRLEAGDTLYIPRGFVHHGATGDDVGSVHITFGLPGPITWTDHLVDVVGTRTPRLDEPVPLGITPDELRAELAVRRDDAVRALRDLDVRAVASELVDRHRPAHPDQVRGRIASALGGPR
jgi:bifunctional lysine-specific demethylase and histidyl-hydroxylase NO66